MTTPSPARLADTLARDLADIAADKLDRLAEDLEALATLRWEQAQATIRDSRVQAAGALDRLAFAIYQAADGKVDGDEENEPAKSYNAACANMGFAKHNATADECRRWARAWRAFCDAAEPTTCSLCHLPRLPLISGRCAECRSEQIKP